MRPVFYTQKAMGRGGERREIPLFLYSMKISAGTFCRHQPKARCGYPRDRESWGSLCVLPVNLCTDFKSAQFYEQKAKCGSSTLLLRWYMILPGVVWECEDVRDTF